MRNHHRYALIISLAALSVTPVLPQEPGWWNDTVFYELYVRSFYDSDGDGTGDLQGVIEKLDYLNDGDPETDTDLGISGIWLMPINPSPSVHGYDVTDYRDIESDYGTLADFEALVDSCHARGIRIILDFVMNHSSTQHPWFYESSHSDQSEYRDWYIWEDTSPGYLGPWGQVVWHYSFGDYYFGLFWSGMPDLNYHTQAVKDEMFDIAAFWLDSLHVDGFRLDAIRHLFEDGEQFSNVPETFEFLQDFRTYYKGVNDQAITVGEVWDSSENVIPYVDGTGIDFCFEFELAESIINGVSTNQPSPIRNAMDEIIDLYPPLQYAPFLSNHDQDRIFDVLNLNENRMKMAAAIYLTLPGVPFIYYGEEVGMIGSGPHEYIRTPMQWSPGNAGGFTSGSPWFPLNSNYPTYNVEVMQQDPNSLWHWYRGLIKARNGVAALRTGNYAEVTSPHYNLLSYARSNPQEMVLLLSNMFIHLYDGPSLTLSESELPEGEYFVSDLVSGIQLGTVDIDSNGGFTDWSAPVALDDFQTRLLLITPELSADEPNAVLPESVSIQRCYPNPFNPEITLEFLVKSRGRIQISMINVTGQIVKVLTDEIYSPGEQTVRWHADDQPAGLYFIQLSTESQVVSQKVMLLK